MRPSRFSPEQMRPFKVTFSLMTPICLTYPFIHFDALIAHLIQRSKDSHDYRSLPSLKVLDIVDGREIPLKYSNGLFHASVSIFDSEEAYVTTIYKKFCEKYLNLRKIRVKKIDRSRGHFRDYMIKLVYIPCKKVHFYGSGEIEMIERLLENLPGLGKKVAIGFGFIKDFKIKEINKDYSIVKDGKAMRPIPIQLLDRYSDVVLMAYKPPYWAKANVAPCSPPGIEVKLKEVVLNDK